MLTGYLDAIRDRVKHAALGSGRFHRAGRLQLPEAGDVEDLGENAGAVPAHPLCRAIAGEAGVSWPFRTGCRGGRSRRVVPAEARHILDADSSQHEAIEAVKAGAHLVMDGPPGTGKSQTIANIIAEARRAGRSCS